MSRLHCAAVIRWAGAIVSTIAALETHTSMPPVTSAGRESTARSATTSTSPSRSSVTTSKPAARIVSTIAVPMPPAAPVTSAVRAFGAPSTGPSSPMAACDHLPMPHPLTATGALAAVDERQILARAAVDHVVLAAAEGVHAVVAGPRADLVVAGVGPDLVVARTALDGVVAGSAGDPVIALAAIDEVIAAVGKDLVVAGAALDRIVAGAAGDVVAPDHVVALQALEHVVATTPEQVVVEEAAHDHVGSWTADPLDTVERILLGGARDDRLAVDEA